MEKKESQVAQRNPQQVKVGENQVENQTQIIQKQEDFNILKYFSPLKIFFLIILLRFFYTVFFGGFPDPVQNPGLITNILQEGEELDIYYEIAYPNLTNLYKWEDKGIFYNTHSNNQRSKNITLTKQQLLAEPQIFIQIQSKKNAQNFIHGVGQLTYMKKKKIVKIKKNLLTQNSSQINQTYIDQLEQEKLKKKLIQEQLSQSEQGYEEYDNEYLDEQYNKQKEVNALHFAPKNYIILVYDYNGYPPNQIPPQYKKMKFENRRLNQKNGKDILVKQFFPILDLDNFWVKDRDYICLDDNTTSNEKEYSLQIEYLNYNVWKWTMIKSIQMNVNQELPEGMEMMNFGGEVMKEQIDELREILFDNDPILVGITFLVSSLHSVFEFMAVKNDIQYWRNLDQYTGLSLQTLYLSFVQDIIITAWLFDSREVSWLIIVQSVVGISVTFWKIKKSSRFEKIKKFPFFKIHSDIKYQNSTKKFDQTAHKWLYIAFVPLLIGYSVYSLYYEEHAGWYSFVLNTLVGFIYGFGFIQMFPQIYINYKLQSVEHMPWRTLIYRFLNTILDDFFAFLITQPWLRRLACFRDDIIFVIYIYQRLKYKVDPRRTQYGFINDDLATVNKGEQNVSRKPFIDEDTCDKQNQENEEEINDISAEQQSKEEKIINLDENLSTNKKSPQEQVINSEKTNQSNQNNKDEQKLDQKTKINQNNEEIIHNEQLNEIQDKKQVEENIQQQLQKGQKLKDLTQQNDQVEKRILK